MSEHEACTKRAPVYTSNIPIKTQNGLLNREHDHWRWVGLFSDQLIGEFGPCQNGKQELHKAQSSARGASEHFGSRESVGLYCGDRLAMSGGGLTRRTSLLGAAEAADIQIYVIYDIATTILELFPTHSDTSTQL